MAYPFGGFAPAYQRIRCWHWRDGQLFLDRISPQDIRTNTAQRIVHDVVRLDIRLS